MRRLINTTDINSGIWKQTCSVYSPISDRREFFGTDFRDFTKMFVFNTVSVLAFAVALIAIVQCQEVIVTKLQDLTITDMPSEMVAYQILYTYTPGTRGNGPHSHSGPALGYVIQGDYLFQTDGEDPRLVKTGETVYIKDKGTHIWSANPSMETTVQVLFSIYGRPGEPVVTFKEEGFERLSYEEAMKIASGSK